MFQVIRKAIAIRSVFVLWGPGGHPALVYVFIMDDNQIYGTTVDVVDHKPVSTLLRALSSSGVRGIYFISTAILEDS
jgi:hypothetical protein